MVWQKKIYIAKIAKRSIFDSVTLLESFGEKGVSRYLVATM